MKRFNVTVEFKSAFTSYSATQYQLEAETTEEAEKEAAEYAKRIRGIEIEILKSTAREF